MITFSGGVDKVPASFGGGYGIVRDPELLKKLREQYATLPRQKNWGTREIFDFCFAWTFYRKKKTHEKFSFHVKKVFCF
jgi:hypothetical protein